ncbi:MAG: YicC/YloC family endoribonuclease [Bacteroidales bacterium]
MIRSMTGYGKSITDTGQKKLNVEIRSLNSKQLDISSKLPWIYKEKEIELRTMISQSLGRGKIDLIVSFDIIDEEPQTVINKNAVGRWYRQLKEIMDETGIKADDNGLLQIIMRLPESIRSEKPELTEEDWLTFRDTVTDAIKIVDEYRIEEGKALEKDMRKSTAAILKYLEEVKGFEADRIVRIRERIVSSLNEIKGSVNADSNRLEQELIYYLEKLDINEEKVRLEKHCDYFIESLSSDEPNGKTLSFITQEIGREINTIGSKANDASIQKLVVMMKEELEKIKEQVQNVL